MPRIWQKGVDNKEKNIKKIINETRCSFCGFVNVLDAKTLTCSNCNTTMPRNYGAHQKKDRHGRPTV